MTLGEKIQTLRQSMGFTQADVVRICRRERPMIAGIVTSALSHWERNRRTPNPQQLLALVDVLRPSCEAILELVRLAAKVDPQFALFTEDEEASMDQRVTAWKAWASECPTLSHRKGFRRDDESEPVQETGAPDAPGVEDL